MLRIFLSPNPVLAWISAKPNPFLDRLIASKTISTADKAAFRDPIWALELEGPMVDLLIRVSSRSSLSLVSELLTAR